MSTDYEAFRVAAVFDVPLRFAAQELINLGAISDVRILKNGRVVTGIAGDRQRVHRVYVQYERAGAETFEGECSCGERSPCAHVAAVVMTAARISGAPTSRRTGTDGVPDGVLGSEPSRQSLHGALPLGAARRQSLCYLVETEATRGFKLSIWVIQIPVGNGNVHFEARPFAPRITEDTEDHPRFVDAADREILRSLTATQFDGVLTGTAGFEVLQRAVATGRTFWRSLQNGAMQWACAREARFEWQALPNGDQRLRCESFEAPELMFELDPAVYFDKVSGHCGPLELQYPVDLLRRYWNLPAIDPAQVSALNANLAREPRADRFPRPHEMTVRDQALSSLLPRLVLSAAPAATLYFLYNGMIVDGDSLRAEDPACRWRDGNIVYQIARDFEFEQEMRAQLDRFLTCAQQGREAWLEFMMHGVPALRTLGWQITVDPEFPYQIAAADDWYVDVQPARSSKANPSQGAKQSREWFDLRLGLMVDGGAVNLLPALVHYLQGSLRLESGRHETLSVLTGDHLLILMEDGRYLPVLVSRIQRIADALLELYGQNGLNERQGLRLRGTQAGWLAQLAIELNAPALQSDDLKLMNLFDAIKDFSRIEPLAAPPQFRATLRPYQEEGLGWLQFLRRHGLGGILADDMGLGKTVQTLAHLVIEKHQGRLNKPSLIVAPVSVLGNWQQEICRFAPGLELLILHGAKRKESFAAIDSADLIIIGYPLLVLDSEILLQREFYFVILDEAQTIKNPHAKVSQLARALRAKHRLCLTGTPMENHLGDLWSLCDFVQPGLLGERRRFQRHYRTPIENGGDIERAAALARRIRPFLLRRTKDEVARDLPPKIQIVEPIELDERQRDFYDGIRLGQHRRVREAIERQGLARSRITLLDALLKLRQACCDPRLIDTDVRSQVIPSAKLDWLTSTLPELIAEGRRILLFSQFTSMLRLVEAALKDLSIPYLLLTGETIQRTELVQRFQGGDVPLLLISLKAGGTGLNLTAADTIIHYDPWWNPAVEAQATDRAHRIGQDKPVFVYKLIAQRTVEEKIMQLQADKHALVSQLYSEKSASGPPLSSDDVEALFAPWP